MDDHIMFSMGYLNLNISTGVPIFSQIFLPLTPCDDTRFLRMKDKTSGLAITNNYLCPPNNYSVVLQGGFSSPISKYFSFLVDYCDQDTLNARYPGSGRVCAN